jgi:hypothetical protein
MTSTGSKAKDPSIAGRRAGTSPASDQAMPCVSISLDLDNLWSYMRIHGDAGWETFPSYLDVVVDLVIERLGRHGLTVTVFVVGQDAALDKNKEALGRLAARGHEIGNHSLSHEPWFHEYSYAEAQREICVAEQHIEHATGQRPRGFRGPGFSLSLDALRVLSERDYIYDASTFPTFLGPIARAYYFWTTKGLTREERARRGKLFGSATEALRPIRPYAWNVPDVTRREAPLVEIPVTTMPLVRLPIHMSYILYLALHSKAIAKAYLRTALALCRWRAVEPSFLLHPLDFVGGDRVKQLAFFPGMRVATSFKLELFDEVVDLLRSVFMPVTMEAHARRILDDFRLERRTFSPS